MRKGILFLVFVLLLVTPVSAEIAFGPGAEGVLYSGDGVAELQALFGSALAISPGETLRESALICLEKGGRLYLECQELPSSLAELHLTVCGEAPIFDGRLGDCGWIYLGNFPAGTREPVVFTLSIPNSLSRQGQLDWQKLRWKLLAEAPQLPATGDRFHPMAALGVAFFSTAGLAALLRKKEFFAG